MSMGRDLQDAADAADHYENKSLALRGVLQRTRDDRDRAQAELAKQISANASLNEDIRQRDDVIRSLRLTIKHREDVIESLRGKIDRLKAIVRDLQDQVTKWGMY